MCCLRGRERKLGYIGVLGEDGSGVFGVSLVEHRRLLLLTTTKKARSFFGLGCLSMGELGFLKGTPKRGNAYSAGSMHRRSWWSERE
jgi:hypothetical protein